jgi:hypothetical protein
MMRLLVAGLGATALLVGSCSTNAEHTSADRPLAARFAGVPVSADRPLQPVGDPGTAVVRADDFPAGGIPAFLTDVRAAGHQTFDRFVLEFDGDTVPSHQVGYVKEPVTEDGSGRSVDVQGAAFLEVRVTPARGFDLSGDQLRATYPGPDRRGVPDGQVVTEAVSTGDFESMLAWTLGLEHRAPFGVATLSNPARLVVDVLHEPADGDSAESPGPVGPASTAGVDADASGPPVVLTDVRLGAHPGFDRVVFQLGGDGSAGYHVGYTDDPRSQESGELVHVPGDAALAVTLTNLLRPADAPPGLQPWEGPKQLRIADTTTLQALVTDGLFRGRHTFFAGRDQRQPFAVARLDDPQRIVVDVLAREPVALGHGCTSPDGVSVSYPQGWSVNTGEVAPACTRFAPQAFSLPQNSDLRVAAITIISESVPFERASEPPAGQKSRIPLTVDGREAVRIEQQTADGLYPLGTPMTSYIVDLGVCEDGPRTLIATTVGLPRFDYARNIEVLDEMVHTLWLSSDRQD